ncbi:MAG: AAA family ATPase [Deltaproteobacteria bacterium]|nr:AAA family ATPase [Deltaproteobacteria bacterium]
MGHQGQALRIPASRRVLLCMGPGGVGKTTVAAAIGLAAAQQGRKVVVVTIDPSRRLAQALGLDPSQAPDSIVEVPIPGGGVLDSLMLDTRTVFDQIVQAYSRDPEAARRMLDNPIYQATAQHLGGALEYAATARVHMLHSEGRYDLIVLDTPPTANALDFIDAPARLQELVDNPAARFLTGGTGRLGLKIMGLGASVLLKTFEAMGGGSFISELGEFLKEFGVVLTEFRRRAGDLAQLLVSPETGALFATAATDFSAREAEGFIDVVVGRKIRVDGIVLNRVLPPLPPLPADAVLRPAVTAAVGEADADSTMNVLGRVYQGVRHQSDRAHRIGTHLRERYPDVPVAVLERRDPPPTGLEDLVEMGTQLLHSEVG